MSQLEVVETIEVDLPLVEEPSHVLRPVDRDTDKFRGLVHSMKTRGYDRKEPIEVSKSDAGTYVVARAGMHRFYAAGAAGLTKVWVAVLNRAPTDAELISGQVQAEATHTDAKPAEYGRAVVKYMALPENRGKTKIEIAREMGRPDTGFLDKVLKIVTLPENVQKLIDDDKISMANGLSLVAANRAGVVFDDDLLRKAQAETADSFQALVASKVQAIRQGPRAAKVAPARLRKVDDVRTELERATKDPSISSHYVRALAWCLRQDPVSAAAEGAAPALTGTDAEGAALRAEVAKLRGALAAADVTIEADKTRVAGLEREVERLNVLVDEKISIIKGLEKK